MFECCHYKLPADQYWRFECVKTVRGFFPGLAGWLRSSDFLLGVRKSTGLSVKDKGSGSPSLRRRSGRRGRLCGDISTTQKVGATLRHNRCGSKTRSVCEEQFSPSWFIQLSTKLMTFKYRYTKVSLERWFKIRRNFIQFKLKHSKRKVYAS